MRSCWKLLEEEVALPWDHGRDRKLTDVCWRVRSQAELSATPTNKDAYTENEKKKMPTENEKEKSISLRRRPG